MTYLPGATLGETIVLPKSIVLKSFKRVCISEDIG